MTVMRMPSEKRFSSMPKQTLQSWLALTDVALTLGYGEMVELHEFVLSARNRIEKILDKRERKDANTTGQRSGEIEEQCSTG